MSSAPLPVSSSVTDGRSPSPEWSSDEDLFARAKATLFTAVVGDVMDRMGRFHQFLPPTIRPLRDDMVVLGRAMPVLEADVFTDDAGPAPRDGRELGDGRGASPLRSPFGLMLQALDDLRPNEVYICSGSSPRYALWGENMATRAKVLGAAGAVLDGYSRDTRGLIALGLPAFSYGPYAQDQAPRGKVIDFRVPIDVQGVLVRPGDVVFGDLDGVCVVPQDIEREVFSRAFERAQSENLVHRALEEGMTAAEAFRRYGVL